MNIRLQQIRLDKGYKSRKQLAEAIGIPENTIKSWERGDRIMSLDKACELADFLHCTLDELAGRKPPYNQVTREESEMLQEFRTLDLRQQSVIKQSVHTMSPRYHEVMEKKQSDAKVG